MVDIWSGMAAQVDVQPGELGLTVAAAGLHLSPLSDSSNKSRIEIPSVDKSNVIASEPSKPVVTHKPRLTPKPFVIERNLTIKPILAPKPQSKPRPESTLLAGHKPDPPSTPKPNTQPLSANSNRPAPTFYKTSKKLNSVQTARPVTQPFKSASPSDPDDQRKPTSSPAKIQKPDLSSLAYSKSPAVPLAAEWSGTTAKEKETNVKSKNKVGASITRAKSMGFLDEVGFDKEQKDEAKHEVSVPLRPKSSRPRPVSAILPESLNKVEKPVPAPRRPGRRPLSADLTSKFESIGLSLHRKSANVNTQENAPAENVLPQKIEDAPNPALESEKKMEENAVKETEEENQRPNIKSRISRPFDSSSLSVAGSPGQWSDPQSPVQLHPETETPVGVKQLIKQLTEDPTQSPAVKPTPKPRPLSIDLTKRFSSEKSPDLNTVTEAADRHEISKVSQREDEELANAPNNQKILYNLKESEELLKDDPTSSVKDTSNTSQNGGPVGELHTLQPSLLDIERHNVTMSEEKKSASTAKDLPRKPSFQRESVDGAPSSPPFKEPASPSSSFRVVPAFDTVQAIEEKKAVSESIPSAQWEDKAMTLRSRRSNTSRPGIEWMDQPQIQPPVEVKPVPRFLRVGALPKWTMADLNQDLNLKKGTQKELQREAQVDKGIDRQRWADEEEGYAADKHLTKEKEEQPRATYFALTGQMQEPSSPKDAGTNFEEMTVPSNNFTVRSALGGPPGKMISAKRNLSLEEALERRDSSLQQLEAMMRKQLSPMDTTSHTDKQTKEKSIKVEEKTEQHIEKENQETEIQNLQERVREQAKQTQNQLEEEKNRHLERIIELERQELLDVNKPRLNEKERLQLHERERPKQKENIKEAEKLELTLEQEMLKEHGKQKEIEMERQKQRQREREKMFQLEQEREMLKKHEKQREIEMERQKQRQLEREKMIQQEQERQREMREKLQEKERELAKERQRKRDEERQRELDKEQQQLEMQKQKHKMEEMEKKELDRQQLELQKEKEKQWLIEEAEKIKQMALEQEWMRLKELEKERARQKELEHQKEVEREKQKEMQRRRWLEIEKLRQRDEKERQQQLEKEKKELERQREIERERERHRDEERQKQLDRERLQLEMQQEKHKKEEEKRELERQQLELQKQRQQELERQQLAEEAERLRQVALEQELLKLRELEKEREKQREVELWKEATREKLRKKQLDLDEQEFENQKLSQRELKEKMEKEEAEKMRQVAKKQELERQRLRQKQREDEERIKLESSAMRPKVLDLDLVLRDELSPKASCHHSDPSTRWREPYKPAILDIDSFKPEAQPSSNKDLFPVSGIQELDASFKIKSNPVPERDLNWKVPPQATTVWTMSPQDPWELQPVEVTVDKPVVEPKRSISAVSPVLPLCKQDQRLPDQQNDWAAFLKERLHTGPLPGTETKSRNSLGVFPGSSQGEEIWIPREPQSRSHRRSQGSQDLNRMRSRSMSRKSARSNSSVEESLSRMRSHSANREQESHSWVQQTQSGEEERKHSETPVRETDSQYGTWETELRSDDSLMSITPSSDSFLSLSQRKPSPPTSPGDNALLSDKDTLDGLPPSSSSEIQPLSFPDAPTTLLDNSALRSKAQLGKKRAQRTRPTRAARQSAAPAAETSEDWLYRDSTEAKPLRSPETELESEKPTRGVDAGLTVPSQLQRVAVFPGLDPSALKAQLKRRSDSDNQTDVPAPSPSQPTRSPKSPFLPRAARVLPPIGGKENGEEGSPTWLKELKSKKRFSQYESENN